MGITRNDLIRKGRDLEMPDEEWMKELAVRQAFIDRDIWNDRWIEKTFKKIAILITSHPGNRPYLKTSVETHKKLGYWICLVYDNYIDPEQPTIDYNSILPSKDVMDNVDLFVQTTFQKWGGVLFPWFWHLKWGTNLLQDFEYIYCTNGDFVLEKPEGFGELFSLMGDADIMTSGPDRDEPPVANTAGFIGKAKALKDIVKHYEAHFIPFENYEKYTQEFGNAEGRLGRAIKDLGLKQVRVEPPLEDMLKTPGHGTWHKLLGFRHIHAEVNYAYRNKGIPPHYKYLDERFAEGDYPLIKEYWDTQDIKVLERWWPQ